MCGKARVYVIFAFAVLLFYCHGAGAALRLSVGRGPVRSVSVSLAPLYAVTDLANKIGSNCSGVILNDLNSTGSFSVHVEVPDGFSVLPEGMPDSDAWTANKHDILLTGSVKEAESGLINLKIFVWDVATKSQMNAKSLHFSVGNWRQAAHSIADLIYSRVTGNTGYFDTKIVYVASDNGVRRIAVMDHDGANSTYITGSKEKWVGLPRFSPDKRQVIYARQGENGSEIMLHDLDREESSMLLHLEGEISSLEFSPTSNEILLSSTVEGKSNILSFNITDGNIQKLTDDGFANASASYSPDGRTIVFSSDRSGSTQLYTRGIGVENQKKISSSGLGKYVSPVWSPRGDLIAFIKVKGNSCNIGVMRPDGSREKIVATDCIVDAPAWASNGRVLLYTKHRDNVPNGESGGSSLVVTDLSGAHRRILPTLGDASDADWSSTLPQG
ncbi:translocation protein TolB [Candidatus Anaplasma sp. TIGMIC]|nr:translocation protein TolB [Candidatus Anaplasma sp. TIGMIC]